jgi:serine/threonine protein kinase
MQPAREPMAAEQFGPYEVYERLGMGGMASVHRAKKRGPADFERTVALKRMLSHLAEDRGFVESFVREAKVVSLLAHPNIAQTYDFGRINGIFYIAMELVAGPDVRKLLRRAHRANQAIPLPVVMSILGELCDALDYAHSFVDENGTPMHIVHRDISPSNMIVAHTGHLKVIDFGIAKANSHQLHTETGTVKGKLGYMAPETALGMPVSPVSDVFSMGVVAWELVTAMPLFSARTDFETMRKLREDQVPAPSVHNPACPPMLDHLILAALHRDPEQRLQTARAFRATLDSIAQQFNITMSARGVADWIRNVLAETSISRLSMGPSHSQLALRRSQAEIALATEVWGEDGATAYESGPDFSSQASPYTPIGLSVPSLASARPSGPSMRPSLDSGVLVHHSQPHMAQHSGTMHPAAYAPPPEAPRSGGKTVLLVLAGLAVVAGVLGGILYARRPATAAPKPALHFIIEPQGAVVEIAGSEVGSGSPIDTELEPGVYSFSVKHAGFQTFMGSVTVAAGDKQTINVALVRDPVAATPVAAVQQPRAANPDGSASAGGSNASEPTRSTTASNDPDKVHKTTKASGQTTRKSHGGKRPSGSTQQTSSGAGSDDDDVVASKLDPVVTKPDHEPVVTKPDPVITKADPPDTKPARTPVVGPNVVQKVSGEIPTLRSSSGSGDVTAKICIDEAGKVTSVKMMKGPADVSTEIQRAMLSWRFKPYTNRDGKVSPVCFPHSVRLLLKP